MMGFMSLEGLVMVTRLGLIDLGFVFWLEEHEYFVLYDVVIVLEEWFGLVVLVGMVDLCEIEECIDADVVFVFDVYVY